MIMRKLVFIMFAFFILISCSNSETTLENDYSQMGDNTSQMDSLKQYFIPKIKGVWVLTDYINEIEKTKSPLKSRHKLYGNNFNSITTMVIDVANQSDSIEVGAGINNHEGYDFVIYFQAGQTKNSLKTNIVDYEEKSNFYEIGYEIKNNITYLFLYHYDKTNKLIGKTQFTKVVEKNQDNDLGFGTQYIVNKKLFSGSFTLIDSTDRKTKIKFNADGTLTGFLNFKTYYVETDYLGAAIIPDIDIILFKNEENRELYAFRVVKDTVLLYSVIFHEEVGEAMTFDDLIYKLVRK